jgi:hypothetical protein
VRPACPSRVSGCPSLATHRGFPCCVRFPCVHARRHYPGAADGCTRRPQSPIRISLPWSHCRVGLHIVLFEACSAFAHVAAYTLARSPIRDRYPKASDTSSPQCLLRLLPAGAGAGRGLHSLEKRRLLTAHVESGPLATWIADFAVGTAITGRPYREDTPPAPIRSRGYAFENIRPKSTVSPVKPAASASEPGEPLSMVGALRVESGCCRFGLPYPRFGSTPGVGNLNERTSACCRGTPPNRPFRNRPIQARAECPLLALRTSKRTGKNPPAADTWAATVFPQ